MVTSAGRGRRTCQRAWRRRACVLPVLVIPPSVVDHARVLARRQSRGTATEPGIGTRSVAELDRQPARSASRAREQQPARQPQRAAARTRARHCRAERVTRALAFHDRPQPSSNANASGRLPNLCRRCRASIRGEPHWGTPACRARFCSDGSDVREMTHRPSFCPRRAPAASSAAAAPHQRRNRLSRFALQPW
jgi:hypothetical protein